MMNSYVHDFGPGTFQSEGIDANDVLTINFRGGSSGEGTGTVTVTALDSGGLSKDESFTITIG